MGSVSDPPTTCTPLDPSYPSRLRGLPRSPAVLTVRGGSLEAERTVAIVGSREATLEAIGFARDLAGMVAAAGAVVVSGGALGIDGAAHQGALAAGGRTWVVAATGCERCFPEAHAGLFEAVARGPGAMIWPFGPAREARPGTFLSRNRILVALADAVVVVQAGIPSGALHAAECARTLKKPLWVVPAPPWARGFEGSRRLLGEGVRPLTHERTFLDTLGLAAGTERVPGAGEAADGERPQASAPVGWSRRAPSADEEAVWQASGDRPLHADEIARRAHVSAQAAAAALLTLALEAVVVEGPPGFFRRRDSHNA